jgi:chromosome segregation ATPase
MQKASIIAVLATVLVSGWLLWRGEAERKSQWSRIQRLEQELANRGVTVPEVDAPVAPLAPEPKVIRPEVSKDRPDVGKYLSLIDELRGRTQELDKNVQTLQLEREQLRERINTQLEEAERIASQMAEAREATQKQQRISDALETELKFKAQRLTQVEQSEKLLQEKLAKADQASRRAVVGTRDLEDLNRRREASLTTLERRYREVTDLYRSFSLNLQTRESSSQGMQAGDLSRIQTALQQAEEELRQLRSLNVRAAELAKAK